MDGTFVKELAERMAEPATLTVGNKTFAVAPSDWKVLAPTVAQVAPLKVSTLAALVDYVVDVRDGWTKEQVLVVVESPTSVAVLDALEGEEQGFRRKRYIEANAAGCGFRFGTFHDSESFCIMLRTLFEATPERDELLLLVASIAENNVRETLDDGVQQEVTTRRGVTVVNRQAVKPVWKLTPYRTFREVEQPASEFVVRLRQGEGSPCVALFEADGGAWAVEAMQNVAEDLAGKLPGVKVLGRVQ